MVRILRRHEANAVMLECSILQLTPSEAQDYVQKRYNKKVSLEWCENRLRRFKKENRANEMLLTHARAGFTLTHFELIDEIRMLRKELMTRITAEDDPKLVAPLASQLIEANRRHGELNIGTPVIAGIKKMLEGEKNVPKPIVLTKSGEVIDYPKNEA